MASMKFISLISFLQIQTTAEASIEVAKAIGFYFNNSISSIQINYELKPLKEIIRTHREQKQRHVDKTRELTECSTDLNSCIRAQPSSTYLKRALLLDF